MGRVVKGSHWMGWPSGLLASPGFCCYLLVPRVTQDILRASTYGHTRTLQEPPDELDRIQESWAQQCPRLTRTPTWREGSQRKLDLSFPSGNSASTLSRKSAQTWPWDLPGSRVLQRGDQGKRVFFFLPFYPPPNQPQLRFYIRARQRQRMLTGRRCSCDLFPLDVFRVNGNLMAICSRARDLVYPAAF